MQDEYITEADVPAATQNGEAAGASVEELQAQLAGATARADENYNKFLLATADFENYKKRAQRQSAELASAGRRRLLEQFLPVLDNLERALAYGGQNSDGLRDGVQQTLRGFEAIFNSEGVKPIPVKGLRFDPKTAEAIGTKAADGVEDDVVVEEAQRGYMIGDDVLRPAKVIVAKHAAADEL